MGVYWAHTGWRPIIIWIEADAARLAHVSCEAILRKFLHESLFQGAVGEWGSGIFTGGIRVKFRGNCGGSNQRTEIQRGLGEYAFRGSGGGAHPSNRQYLGDPSARPDPDDVAGPFSDSREPEIWALQAMPTMAFGLLLRQTLAVRLRKPGMLMRSQDPLSVSAAVPQSSPTRTPSPTRTLGARGDDTPRGGRPLISLESGWPPETSPS